MPTSGMALQEFELQRVDYTAPEAGGRVGGVQAGFPLWAATWTIGKIGEGKSDELRAFVAELRGAIRTFYGFDLRRQYPKAYPQGFAAMTRVDGSPFYGNAASWSSAIDASDDCLLSLTGLPSGFIVSTGDYVMHRWDDTDYPAGNQQRRTVSRVIRDGGGTADADGKLTIKVEPPIPSAVHPLAVADFANPCCVMRIVTAQTKLDAIDRRGAIRGGTIVAIQDLRA